MSKTIDVEKGDTWTKWPGDPGMYQYRGTQVRYVADGGTSGVWSPSSKQGVESSIPWCAARAILESWDYTITTPAAKDEAPAKTEPTPDVPMVGDIWVEHDGVLSGYSQWNKMHALHGYEIRNGTARIVRLAPDADLAATVKRMEGRVNDLTKIVHGLQNSMPGYDKDVTADEAFRRFDEQPSKLEAATTTAKVRVVAPANLQIVGTPGHSWVESRDSDWRAYLTAQGIDVVKKAGK